MAVKSISDFITCVLSSSIYAYKVPSSNKKHTSTILFNNHIFLIHILQGLGINQAVLNKCHLFGWYLGCLFHLKKAVFVVVVQDFILACQSILVTLVLETFATSVQSSYISHVLGILKEKSEWNKLISFIILALPHASFVISLCTQFQPAPYDICNTQLLFVFHVLLILDICLFFRN